MLCVKSRYDEILADQDALNLCRHILAEGQVCTCLFNQVCLGNLHVLTTVVTAVQMRRSIVHPSLAKRLVQRGSLVLVGSVLEFPSTLHAEYFRQAAVSCQGPLASETVHYACNTGAAVQVPATVQVQFTTHGHPCEGSLAGDAPPPAAGAHH